MSKKKYKSNRDAYLAAKQRRRLHIIIFAAIIAVITLGICYAIIIRDNPSNPPSPPQTTTATQAPTAAVTTSPTTEAATTEPTTEAPRDPREDVLTHYDNLAVVNLVNNYLNVRDQPSTDGMIVGKLLKNSEAEILEDTGTGWYYIKSGDVTGYIGAEYVTTGKEAEKLAIEYCVPMIEVTTERLNVRSGPGMEYDVWTQLNGSEHQVIEEEVGDWYKVKINNTTGYVNKEYVKESYYLPEAISWSTIDNITGIRRQLIDWGAQYLGVPYVYGGTDFNTGVDCSYFTMSCYNSIGISLMRTSREQATQGREVTLAEALPGDLLFYADSQGVIDHVAIYIGDGKILHAANSFHQVVISTYNYSTEPVAVRRYIEE
ncbi:MAG: SH3 domain-containing protein [Lachnospiraceae bacterium]